jgi:hypothetical protein
VLPDVGVAPNQVLRPTELGSILQKGGTITGRRREQLLLEQQQNNNGKINGPASGPYANGGAGNVVNGGKPPGKYERLRSKSAVVYLNPEATGTGSSSSSRDHQQPFDGGGRIRATSRTRNRSAR